MPSITKRRAKQSKVEYNGKENTMELEKMLVTPAQLSRASTDKRDTGALAMILSEQQNDNRAVQQAQSSPPLMCAVMTTGPREMCTWQ